MSKTAAFGLAPSATPFARLMATIDRLLMASARIARALRSATAIFPISVSKP
jgi:hypothetical protein